MVVVITGLRLGKLQFKDSGEILHITKSEPQAGTIPTRFNLTKGGKPIEETQDEEKEGLV